MLIRRRHSTLLTMLSGAIALGMLLSCGVGERERTAERLQSAALSLDSLTDASPGDVSWRAAIAWGYAERLRLGLESPFRLIESASRDPRLTAEEQQTVAWALLARVLDGESHHIDAAALDGLGPFHRGEPVHGDQHLAWIEAAVASHVNPRAGELGVRLAYTLAAAEQLVDASAPTIAAEAAALLSDREIARREAEDVLRAARGSDPISELRRRRQERLFYLERPVLLAPPAELERRAISIAAVILDSLRSALPVPATESQTSVTESDLALASQLYEAGSWLPPVSAIAVTVRRYAPMVRRGGRATDEALNRARNSEMLLAATRALHGSRMERRGLARLILASAVSVRSLVQEPVWFPGDSVPSVTLTASEIGVGGLTFDSDVPGKWRPYLHAALAGGIRDLRRVLPAFSLDDVHVRFRMTAPSDSALAMHDPRTRTLHLPVSTWAGALLHELAHDLDRQSALKLEMPGYRSDLVARSSAARSGARTSSTETRLATSLRALTEEPADARPGRRSTPERPAEIFATRVDWFVANALAKVGVSNGILSAVQDELLTGHVVHPERLRGSGHSRSLVTALEEMTTVASFAVREEEPSLQSLLRWSLATPLDRSVAAEIVQGDIRLWQPRLLGARACRDEADGRAMLLRMAAESRARGWLRLRSRWVEYEQRAAWAHTTLRHAPWASDAAEQRVAALRDYVLAEIAAGTPLNAGMSAYAAPLAAEASCSR